MAKHKPNHPGPSPDPQNLRPEGHRNRGSLRSFVPPQNPSPQTPAPPNLAATDAAPRPLPLLPAFGLSLLSAALLYFAYAPFNQFYLAWIALIPLLVASVRVRSGWRAALCGLLAGLAFFIAGGWWFVIYSAVAGLAYMAVQSVYWTLGAFAARLLVLALLPDFPVAPTARRLLAVSSAIAAVWIGLEFIRTEALYASFEYGLFLIGLTQSPVPALCQTADLAGVYLVGFPIVATNALLALLLLPRLRRRPAPSPRTRLAAALAPVVSISLILAYGAFRLTGSPAATDPGPVILALQVVERVSAEYAGTPEDRAIIDHFIDRSAPLALPPASVDVIVWPENVFPPLNPQIRSPEAEAAYADFDLVPFTRFAHDKLLALSRATGASIVVGAPYYDGFSRVTRPLTPGTSEVRVLVRDVRNCAYVYYPDGTVGRYEKSHLMAGGEDAPFRHTFPALHLWLINAVNGPDQMPYTPGPREGVQVFQTPTRPAITPATPTTRAAPSRPSARFVTPICSELYYPSRVRDLFYSASEGKRADLLIGISFNGHFAANAFAAMAQAQQFRCIEHRVPAAISAHTGLTVGIDSAGRLIPGSFGTPGVDTEARFSAPLDPRVTLYARTGDLFAITCLVAAVAATLGAAVSLRRARPLKARTRPAPSRG